MKAEWKCCVGRVFGGLQKVNKLCQLGIPVFMGGSLDARKRAVLDPVMVHRHVSLVLMWIWNAVFDDWYAITFSSFLLQNVLWLREFFCCAKILVSDVIEIRAVVFHTSDSPCKMDGFWCCLCQVLTATGFEFLVLAYLLRLFWFHATCWVLTPQTSVLPCRKLYFKMCSFLSLQDCLRACQEQIEQALATNLPQANPSAPSQPPNAVTPTSKCETGHPTTPTDVRDVLYWAPHPLTHRRKTEKKERKQKLSRQRWWRMRRFPRAGTFVRQVRQSTNNNGWSFLICRLWRTD